MLDPKTRGVGDKAATPQGDGQKYEQVSANRRISTLLLPFALIKAIVDLFRSDIYPDFNDDL